MRGLVVCTVLMSSSLTSPSLFGASRATLKLGSAEVLLGERAELPLELSTDEEVQAVSAVFEWDASAGTGVELRVAPGMVSSDFVQVTEGSGWMALGLVVRYDLSAGIPRGENLPLATLVIENDTASDTQESAVVFRDGVHRAGPRSEFLTNSVTIDAEMVDRSSGLDLVDGRFRLLPRPDGRAPEISCDDGEDNDGDGRIDCADPDCGGYLPCVDGVALRVDVLRPSAERGAAREGVAEWTASAPLGRDVTTVTTGVNLVSNLGSSSAGVEGWSVSLLAEECFRLTDVTTAGTVAAPVTDGLPGLRRNGFEVTEIVDPSAAENGGRTGVVSAVVLSQTLPVTLAPAGDELVLVVTGEVDSSAIRRLGDRSSPACTVRPLAEAPWLRGSGQSVETAVTADQHTLRPEAIGAAVILEGAEPAFVRGDADQNGSINITDGIRTLRYLFVSGEPPLCFDAADANDDGELDLSDGVSTFAWLFSDTSTRPPAPSPSAPDYAARDCGVDPTPDGLGCETSLCL